MSAISVTGLARSFRVGVRSRRVEAVRDVSLEVLDNEVFGFVGPNGAGKSTTIHMLLGLVRPDRGQGTVLGQPFGSLEARRRVGYLPELPHFYNYLKAGELLEMFGQLAGCSNEELNRTIPELLDRVGLGGHMDAYLKTFSKGMLQRVGLAQALIGDPELVILDEPMSGLDPIGRHVVRSVIIDLKARGKTVFFSSHVLPDIEALCDRVALIANGKTLRTATVQEMVAGGRAQYEVQVRGVDKPPPDLPGVTQMTQAGGNLRLVIDGEDSVERIVRWASAAGQLVSLLPIRENLEDVIVREVTADESGGAS